MFCPNCRSEYQDGIIVCADCGAELIPVLSPIDESSEMVTVLETGDLSTVVLAKSILDEAEIPYFAKGEIPLEQLAVGPVEIQVDRRDGVQARELLEGLADGGTREDLHDTGEDEPADDD